MASTTSASPLKGFSVLQPGLGAPLSWMPAVGSKELTQLIDAYLPGPASAQDKRAAIATDFFKFAAETGESFKYYQVNLAQASPSPASSAFSASPAMSNMSYSSPSQPSTPATSSRSAAIKIEKTDYSHLPGMKILTTDGQDVTNSLSRGCKSKEQREHAHLMRVLKACDACKKKKIRCDPSHKRRQSSQVSAKAVAKPAKKTKKSASAAASQATPASTTAAFTPAPEPSYDFDLDFDMNFDASFEDMTAMDMDELFNFNQAADTIPQDFYSAMPQHFDFYLGNDSLYSPAMTRSTSSFNSPVQPLTPTGSGLLPQGEFAAFSDTNAQANFQYGDQEPNLPYMASGPHGSNYTDFSLYSPSSSFIDEEPMKLKAGGKRRESSQMAESSAAQSRTANSNESPAGHHEARASTGLADEQQWGFDRTGHGTVNPQMLRSSIPSDQLQQQEVVGHLEQRPHHGDDEGRDGSRASTTARLSGFQPQVVNRNLPGSAPTRPDGHERNNLATGSLRLAAPANSSPASPPTASPLNAIQDVIRLGANSHTQSRTVSPSQSLVEGSSHPTSICQARIEGQSIPSITSPAATRLSDPRERREDGLLAAGGLPVNGRLLVNNGITPVNRGNAASGQPPTSGLPLDGVLHMPPHAGKQNVSNAANGSLLNIASAHEAALVRRIEASTQVSVPVSRNAGSLGSKANEGRAIGNLTATTTTSSGLGSFSPSQHRQELHGKPALAASSFPHGCQSHVDPLPMRQMLGDAASSLSWLLTHLAVFGLVSLLLNVGLTSLLQLQAPLLAYLPSSSIVILSLLSLTTWHHSVLDTAKSIPSGASSLRRRRQYLGRAASAGLVCVPLACF